MDGADGAVEVTLESVQRLWCKTDFRHKNKGLLTPFDHLVDQIHVNLGFTAAGDTLQ